MKGLKHNLWLVTILFLVHNTHGQTKINGRITDTADSTAIPFVSVIIYKYQSNEILNYVQTDIEGYYNLEISSKPQVVTVKTSHLSYHPYQQDIVIGSSQSEQITLAFGLSPKAEKLQEVIIKGPIIVKEDTIIYDVEHWTEARDQTLEEVLAKIPGFKIRADGEIEVNGKTVDKVLIDGEEVTNSGARLLTRSIAPEDVESIEVRLDEKNDKLKESLLDTRKYIVLDIKLKKELNKSLFGKIRATVGYQNNAALGGYLNAFSLKKKLKMHLFAEHDRFGEQTISLDQIKNIGAEALQKLFKTPADFKIISEREIFHEQIFGFKNYTIAYKDIVGLTSRYTISPYIDLYFGTYNAYAKNGKSRNYSQEFNVGQSKYQFEELQTVTDYSSKNKLELRLDKGKVKARLDVNAVVFDNKYQNYINEYSENRNYNYADRHKSKSFYENLFIEYAPTSKFGIRGVASYSYIDSDHAKSLIHNNPLYRSFLLDENNNLAYDFGQNVFSKTSNFVSEIMSKYSSSVGLMHFGLRFQDRVLDASKTGFNRNDATNSSSVAQFTGVRSYLNFRKWTHYLKHQRAFGVCTFQNEIAFVKTTYPNHTNIQKHLESIEFSTSTLYNPYPFYNIMVTLSRRISSFPMEKIIEGNDLIGFQTISIPNQYTIRPTPEYTFNILVSKKFDDIDLFFEPDLYYGRIQNVDRYLFNQESVIAIAYDQLRSEYINLTFPVTKSFKKIPLEISFEPEWLLNKSYNVTPSGKLYQISTSRLIWEIKLSKFFENKPYNFFVHPNYSIFSFENELDESKHKQEMFSLNLTAKFDFFGEKLLITPTLRAVTLFGNVQSDFTNISLKIESPSSKFRWFVIIDNLLNNTSFITQTIYPTFFISENNSVFERYMKFGIEYKFK